MVRCRRALGGRDGSQLALGQRPALGDVHFVGALRDGIPQEDASRDPGGPEALRVALGTGTIGSSVLCRGPHRQGHPHRRGTLLLGVELHRLGRPGGARSLPALGKAATHLRGARRHAPLHRACRRGPGRRGCSPLRRAVRRARGRRRRRGQRRGAGASARGGASAVREDAAPPRLLPAGTSLTTPRSGHASVGTNLSSSTRLVIPALTKSTPGRRGQRRMLVGDSWAPAVWHGPHRNPPPSRPLQKPGRHGPSDLPPTRETGPPSGAPVAGRGRGPSPPRPLAGGRPIPQARTST